MKNVDQVPPFRFQLGQHHLVPRVRTGTRLLWKEFLNKLVKDLKVEAAPFCDQVFEEEKVRREGQGAQTGTSIGNHLGLCGGGLGSRWAETAGLVGRGGLVGQYSEGIPIRLRNSI